MVEVFAQDIFRGAKLSESKFCCSLHIISIGEGREGAGDASEYLIRRGVVLSLDVLQAAQIVGHEVLRAGLQDRIEILIRSREFTSRYIDVGATETSQLIIGIDFERFAEKPHRPVCITTRPEHVAFDLQQFGRFRVGGDRLIDHPNRFFRARAAEKPSELDPRLHDARVQFDRIAQ